MPHLRTTDLCNKNFLRPYIDLLKNGTVVDWFGTKVCMLLYIMRELLDN